MAKVGDKNITIIQTIIFFAFDMIGGIQLMSFWRGGGRHLIAELHPNSRIWIGMMMPMEPLFCFCWMD